MKKTQKSLVSSIYRKSKPVVQQGIASIYDTLASGLHVGMKGIHKLKSLKGGRRQRRHRKTRKGRK